MNDYKQIDNYSDYGVNSNGDVMQLDVMEPVAYGYNRNQSREDVLLTEDIITDLPVTGKQTRLNRRHTRQDLINAYHKSKKFIEIGTAPHPKSVLPVNSETDSTKSAFMASIEQVVQSKKEPISAEIVQVNKQLVQNDSTEQGKNVQVIINGKTYSSINEASSITGIHRNTIRKRLDDDTNPNYKYL